MVASSTKTGYGRLPKVTNGRFVAAKLEKPALCIGQLWRSPKVGYGSVPSVRTAGMQSSVQRDSPVDIRGQLYLV